MMAKNHRNKQKKNKTEEKDEKKLYTNTCLAFILTGYWS
jgi:hypothetical protein